MTAYENFTIDQPESVAHVTMDSTARFNTLHQTLLEELLDLTTSFAEDDTVRCITLTGNDEAFSAGADLASLNGNADDAATLRTYASLLHDSIVQLHHARTPLVTGVNGVAAGAGFSLAILGDIVLISEDARFEYAYPRVGLTGDGGSTYYLPRLVGLRRAKEILLLDEPIPPTKAVDLGLATDTVPADELEDRLAKVADTIAAGPTHAYGATKHLLTTAYDRGLADQLANETDTIATATHTTDYERGYAAFFDRTDPEFTGH